jgi:hypothetical protein
MFIKCKNCNAENPLGAIFCRSCGIKLDLEGLDKDIENFRAQANKKNKFNSILRLILILVFIFILYLLYSIINPFGKGANDSLTFSNEVKQEAISKYNIIHQRSRKTVSLSSKEANYIINRYLFKKSNNIFVDTVLDKYISVTIREDVIKEYVTGKKSDKYLKWKLSITAVCEPYYIKTKSGKSLISFKLIKLKTGDLFIPSYFHKYILNKFKPYYSSRKVKKLASTIKKLTIKDGKIILSFKNPRRTRR